MEEVDAVCSYSSFCLGMCEWTDCPGGLYLQTEARLLPLNEPQPSSTFRTEPQRFNFASDEQLSDLAKGLIPANTCKPTKWALKVFELWRQTCNQIHQGDPVPDELFTTNDPSL